MIRVRLQIEDGNVYFTDEKYGLIYVNGDKRFAAPTREFESTTYPEQAGKNIIPITVDEAFAYNVKFFIKADGKIDNANNVIATFNKSLYTQNGDLKTFKQVTFYDDYKKVKIVGYPQPIKEASEFWRDAHGIQHDVVVAEWSIEVDNPNLCDFNLK